MAPWGYPPARARLTDLRRAAHQGDVSAQFTLGWMYDDGDGVPRDYRDAATWYTRAAGQGHANAQFNLALMLDAGRGAARDRAAADHWYRLAAAHGHQQAQRMIDALTVRPLPGPFDPYEPSTNDAVLIQRASERAAAAYCAAHQATRHAARPRGAAPGPVACRQLGPVCQPMRQPASLPSCHRPGRTGPGPLAARPGREGYPGRCCR